MAIQDIAGQINMGIIEIGLAISVESMTVGGDLLKKPFSEEIQQRSQEAIDCMMPMGQTSENVSREFGISRQTQDEFAAESYRRAGVAQAEGWFNDEISPITAEVNGNKVTLSKDEGIRSTSYEVLSKPRPVFTKWGDKSTAGNSSQMTDAVLQCCS